MHLPFSSIDYSVWHAVVKSESHPVSIVGVVVVDIAIVVPIAEVRPAVGIRRTHPLVVAVADTG